MENVRSVRDLPSPVYPKGRQGNEGRRQKPHVRPFGREHGAPGETHVFLGTGGLDAGATSQTSIPVGVGVTHVDCQHDANCMFQNPVVSQYLNAHRGTPCPSQQIFAPNPPAPRPRMSDVDLPIGSGSGWSSMDWILFTLFNSGGGVSVIEHQGCPAGTVPDGKGGCTVQ